MFRTFTFLIPQHDSTSWRTRRAQVYGVCFFVTGVRVLLIRSHQQRSSVACSIWKLHLFLNISTLCQNQVLVRVCADTVVVCGFFLEHPCPMCDATRETHLGVQLWNVVIPLVMPVLVKNIKRVSAFDPGLHPCLVRNTQLVLAVWMHDLHKRNFFVAWAVIPPSPTFSGVAPAWGDFTWTWTESGKNGTPWVVLETDCTQLSEKLHLVCPCAMFLALHVHTHACWSLNAPKFSWDSPTVTLSLHNMYRA